MSWLVPSDELTADQRRIVELPLSNHWCILGAPGSGKTLALLYRAQNLIEQKLVTPDRLRIFVFTKVLKQYIRNALEELTVPENSVMTLDDWCLKYFEQHISHHVPRNNNRGLPDFDQICREVLSRVRMNSPIYDAILVDEGQDLKSDRFDLLRL